MNGYILWYENEWHDLRLRYEMNTWFIEKWQWMVWLWYCIIYYYDMMMNGMNLMTYDYDMKWITWFIICEMIMNGLIMIWWWYELWYNNEWHDLWIWHGNELLTYGYGIKWITWFIEKRKWMVFYLIFYNLSLWHDNERNDLL